MMAITAKDIYPKESWNYVFGLSSLKDRVSVTSIYRLQEEDENNKCLERLIKISSHEITHMLSVKHCINVSCLMNGSNHLEETDSKPNRLCSECTGKLTWNLGMNPIERMQSLSEFFRKHELREDLEKINLDIEKLKG